jgi:hypothetical protein
VPARTQSAAITASPECVHRHTTSDVRTAASTESQIKEAVRAGMLPLEAYERYGTF